MSGTASATAAGPPPAEEPRDKRQRELVTPEGVDLKLLLPTAGDRIAALFLDLAFIVAALVGGSILIVVAAFATWWSPGEMLVALWLLGFFALRNFYFVWFELSPRAATPGKRLLGLRVAMRSGGPLTAGAVFARNAMRELELFLPLSFLVAPRVGVDAMVAILGATWCSVFVIFPFVNRDQMRVGDLVAGTWVITAPKRLLEADIAGEAAPAMTFAVEALNAYGIKELEVLEEVLRRRDPAVIKAVAERIRSKIGVAAHEPDLDFLLAYYKALRAHLEWRLVFGRRRRDKFDKP